MSTGERLDADVRAPSYLFCLVSLSLLLSLGSSLFASTG